MAREVISWCDRHLHVHQEHVVGTEVRVGVDGQWWSADLCDGCAKELVNPVARLLVEHGAPIKREAPQKSALNTKAAFAGNVEVFPLPDVIPNDRQVQLHVDNLARRRAGRRVGRQPVSSLLMCPCLFCGIVLREGGNSSHLAIHGFSSIGLALGRQCPYCGKTSDLLGMHLQRSHGEDVSSRTLTRELLRAHLAKAPYDVVPALRARALNTEPLETVLEALTDA